MYIVLTAMLALNVSSDVLDGFGQVEEGLARSNATVDQRNEAVFRRLEAFAEQNPERVRHGLTKPQKCALLHLVSMVSSIL